MPVALVESMLWRSAVAGLVAAWALAGIAAAPLYTVPYNPQRFFMALWKSPAFAELVNDDERDHAIRTAASILAVQLCKARDEQPSDETRANVIKSMSFAWDSEHPFGRAVQHAIGYLSALSLVEGVHAEADYAASDACRFAREVASVPVQVK